MSAGYIRYKAGYKYQLVEDFGISTRICPGVVADTGYITLLPSGKLVIKSGYAWNGASGPTFDTKSSMRGSLVHDALYQLIRLGKLEPCWRKDIDRLFEKICKEDGMWSVRAALWERAVRWFGGSSVRPSSEPQIEVAP